MERGKRKKQIPPAARRVRNDNLGVFRRVAEVWLWLGDSALLRIEVVWRSERPHPSRPGRDEFRGELQLRVEAGSMAGRREVVGLGFVAGRAGVGVIRTVRVRGRAGRGSRS